MIRIIVWILGNAIAVAVAALLLDGIGFDGPTTGQDEWTEKILPLLSVSVIMGLVTVFVEPFVKFFSLPFIILTVGLFLLVVNALMLMLTAWIAGELGVGFYVDGFWTAMLGSIIITIVTFFVDLVVQDD